MYGFWDPFGKSMNVFPRVHSEVVLKFLCRLLSKLPEGLIQVFWIEFIFLLFYGNCLGLALAISVDSFGVPFLFFFSLCKIGSLKQYQEMENLIM